MTPLAFGEILGLFEETWAIQSQCRLLISKANKYLQLGYQFFLRLGVKHLCENVRNISNSFLTIDNLSFFLQIFPSNLFNLGLYQKALLAQQI